MKQVELYDQRFDWLVASLAAIPLVWLFYGLDAAFVSLLLFALIGALKPIISRLGSRLAAGVFAAGAVLLLSPLLRYVFYNGYCYEGPWSVAAGISRYQMPDICERGLLSHLAQGMWVGPLRDLAMPVLGVALGAFAWTDGAHDGEAVETGEDEEGYFPPSQSRAKALSWSLFALAAFVWAGGSLVNYRAEQAALEERRVAEAAARAAEAAAEKREAERLAAEKAAKRVDLKWLVGAWAPLDGLSQKDQANRDFYCGTDTGYTFNKDGGYVGAADEGRFTLKDNEIVLSSRTSFEIGEPDAPTENLDPTTLKVERSDKRLIIDGSTYGRC